MWTESDEPHRPEAAYYGAASVSISGILLLMAVPALTLAFLLQATDYPGWGRSDKTIAAYGGYAGAAVVEIFCFAALAVGVRGLGVAGRTGEPRVLCWAGIFLSLFAVVLWLACGFAWHSQAGRFIP